METPTTIPAAFAVARKRTGLSARELSAKAGMSPSYVTKLEAGEVEPSLKVFARLAMAVGMTKTEILFCVYLAS